VGTGADLLVLSYARTLTVSVVADADAMADLPELRSTLQGELDVLSAGPEHPRPGPG
jgi:hypothetical protein